ncbi:MAG: zinc-binding alcohol dehydrogenase [Acidobacteria bacterium]|nr:zinc-binding alcohol dehydrogenase [Acidobacteriota bacterium]
MSRNHTARQFRIQSPGLAEIVQVDLPPGQAGEVLVRARYSGISRGTEALVFKGAVPPSQYQAMRAPFQQGDYPGPVTCGYSSVGEVVESGAGAEPGLAGRTVFCLHPHQDLYRVPAAAVTPLPEGVPAARAVLGANMETAVNVCWDARPAPGDRIVVIGAGVVGLLAAWLCRQVPAAAVTVVDVNPAREAAARALGLPFAVQPPSGGDADLVIHSSGHPDGLRAALASAGVEGTIVDASWYGARPVPLPLGEAVHARRLTIRSSQVGRIPPSRAPRWSHARRLALALELLRAAALDTLISGESEFAELPDVLARLSRDPRAALCHRIKYPEA